jgi:hypothetical protein
MTIEILETAYKQIKKKKMLVRISDKTSETKMLTHNPMGIHSLLQIALA